MALELGDVKGMSRLFDVATYLEESAGWNVVALVNVAAAVGPADDPDAVAPGPPLQFDASARHGQWQFQ